MIVSGLSGTLSRCPQLPPGCLESRRVRVMAFSVAGKCTQRTAFPRVERYAQLSLPIQLGNRCMVHALWNGKQFIIFLTLSIYRTSFSSPGLKCNRRQVLLVRSAMDASYGDMSNDSAGKFSILMMKLNSYIS